MHALKRNENALDKNPSGARDKDGQEGQGRKEMECVKDVEGGACSRCTPMGLGLGGGREKGPGQVRDQSQVPFGRLQPGAEAFDRLLLILRPGPNAPGVQVEGVGRGVKVRIIIRVE